MPSLCSACGADIPATETACPGCGHVLLDGSTTVARPPRAAPERDARPVAAQHESPSPHGRFVPGTVLANRYRIVSLLGRGGMGEVYRADDLTLGEPVALKFMSALGSDEKRLAMFREEARLSRQLAHPHICRVYDIGAIDGLNYLSMAYIDGENLQGLLHRIGRLSSDKALQLAKQICSALAAAHDRGVLHRDLKPANIMIDGRGTAHIADFGVASVIGDPSAMRIAGTPAYMAPEQRDRGEVSVQSDLYALGLILCELFTGQRVVVDANPPDSAKLLDALAGVNPAIERIILQCMANDPIQRPQSVSEIVAELSGAERSAMKSTKSTKSHGPIMPIAMQSPRLKTGLILFGSLVLTIIVGAVIQDSRVFAQNATSQQVQARAFVALMLLPLAGMGIVFVFAYRPLRRAIVRVNLALTVLAVILAGFTVISAGSRWDLAMMVVFNIWLIGVIGGTLLTVLMIRLRKPKPDPGPVCPNCQYSLIGVREHRCPECGRPFTLRELGITLADLEPKPFHSV